MDATILDTHVEQRGTCYLCRLSLEDYITTLPDTYQQYDIQREIVTNVYLDHLVDTVLQARHIPTIVLVVEDEDVEKTNKALTLSSFKIIDGLQRTFRLKAIRDTIGFCLNEVSDDEDYLSWNKFKFSRMFSTPLRKLNSSTEMLRTVLEFRQANSPKELAGIFKRNQQWFEIWTGLSAEDEVRMMLTLNAGHKPVKTRHQLELLFLNLLPMLKTRETERFQLVRERDIDASQFSKRRDPGMFHFAHIITSLLSLYEGKPVATSTSLIQTIQASDTGIEEYSELTSPEFIKFFVTFLVQLDELTRDAYGESGVLWMGREVSLAGLFGALGAHADKEEVSPRTEMRSFLELVRDHPKLLNLDEFESQRNSLELSKINFGNVNRNAVFNGILHLLSEPSPKKIEWRKWFGTEGR